MKQSILALLLTCVTTTAGAFPGSELLDQCRQFLRILDGEKTDLHQTLNAGLCGGYVLGVQEGFVASSELAFIASEDQGTKPVTGKYWDIPEDVEAETVVRIVVKYLEINPDMQAKPAVLSVLNALIQTYPVGKDE